MGAYVVRVVAGPAAGAEQDLDEPVTAGRDPQAGLVLAADSLVSWAHARLTPGDGGVVVADLESRNGTFVNGERVGEPVLVAPGDRVQLGETTIEIATRESTAETESDPFDTVAVDVAGPGGDASFVLSSSLEVGRDPAAGVPLADDPQVSWRHARLSLVAGGVRVEDLGSRNGTFADGARVTGPTVVPLGRRVNVGETVLTLRGAAPAPPAPFALHVVDGPETGREAELTTSLTLGRDSSAGLQLASDPEVSRLHARVQIEADQVSVEDLRSRNGTFVNGSLVAGIHALQPGDVVVVGSSALELRGGAGGGTGTVVREGPGAAETVIRAGPDAPGAPAVVTDRTPVWTFLICAFALFMAVLDNLVVLFALPSIQQELDATVQDLEWTVNAFTLAFAVCLLPAATLGDRFGRRRVFAGGIALFTLASAGCALSPNIEALLGARAVQGIGAAVITPLSLTVLSAAFPAQKRGLVLGAWSGIAGLAIAVGPVVGGVIVTGLDWQWIFWVNVPIGAVLAPLCFVLVRESFGVSVRLDLPGILLSATGLFSLVFGAVRASAVGWGSAEVVGALVVGAALLAAFVAWERRATEPLLSLHLFRIRAFAAANASSFCMYFGLFGTIFLLAQFLQLVQGYSALEAGLRSLPLTGMPIVVAPIAGALSERIGGRPLMAAGLALEAVALVWLALVVEPAVPYGQLLVPFVLGGIGLGLFFAPVAHVVLGSVRLEEEGQASGANNAIRQVGGVVGVSIMTTIFTSYGDHLSPAGFVDGLVPPLWFGAGVLAVGSAIALLIPSPEAGDEVVSMRSSLPAVGGFTPGATVVLPTISPSGAKPNGPGPTRA